MEKKRFKRYGRVKTNKLDWLLAIVCCIFAIAALWISLGISIANAGGQAVEALKIFGRGLGFVLNADAFGQSAIVSTFVLVCCYGSLLLLIFGSIYLSKKCAKERIPGLVAAFIAAIGFSVFFSFAFEFIRGNSAGSVNYFWPGSLIVFVVVLFCLIVFSAYYSLNLKTDIELVDVEAEEEPEEAQPVYENIKEEEPEPEPEPQPEPEPEPEPEVEEEPEVEDEESEEVEDDPFAGLGKRRKRVPFENKIKRAKPETKQRYKEIVTALREYDFNDRKSIPCETFSYKKEKLVVLTFSGQTLKAYFKLNPADFADSPIPAKDASDVRKYEDTPLYLAIKSDLAARRVIALAQRVIEENNVPKK